MSKPKNVLIIEHEALTIDAITNAFNEISFSEKSQKFNFTILKSNDSILETLKGSYSKYFFDIVVLNINMPKPNYKKITFTEDLCLELKKLYYNIKVILISSKRDNYRVHQAFKNLSPEGFLIKSDIDFKKLVLAISFILEDIPYYSKQILNLIRCNYRNNLYLDKINILILYHLSKGVSTKDLLDLVPLSIGGIERRKRHLKDIFNVENMNDENLLSKAKELGFI